MGKVARCARIFLAYAGGASLLPKPLRAARDEATQRGWGQGLGAREGGSLWVGRRKRLPHVRRARAHSHAK